MERACVCTVYIYRIYIITITCNRLLKNNNLLITIIIVVIKSELNSTKGCGRETWVALLLVQRSCAAECAIPRNPGSNKKCRKLTVPQIRLERP